MTSSLLRTSLFLSFVCTLALACGGRAIEYVGPDGGPIGSSSSSGSGGSSGGSGSSSGGWSSSTSSGGWSSSTSSGGWSSSSSGSGSSSGGWSSSTSSGGWSSSSSGSALPCPPIEPAGSCQYYGQFCYYPEGCGVSCDCYNGTWECAADPCPPPACPPSPPPPGETCGPDGINCGYAGPGGCGGEDCICSGGTWQCSGMGCPPPTCPSSPPGNGDACNQFGSLCDYPINGNVCSTWECDCYGDGTWGCYETNCGWDAGAGSSSSGGWIDAGGGPG